MFDESLRTVKNNLMTPMARAVSFLTPTQLSMVGLFIALAMFGALYQGWFLIGAVLWWLNRIFDGLDGIVAREYDMQSDFGGYLDIMADHVAYIALPVGVILGQPFSEFNWLALTFLLATFYANAASWMYLSAVLEKRDRGAKASGETTTVTMPRGLVAGFETIVFFSLFALLPRYAPVLFLVMGAMIIGGMFYRLWWAGQNLD